MNGPEHFDGDDTPTPQCGWPGCECAVICDERKRNGPTAPRKDYSRSIVGGETVSPEDDELEKLAMSLSPLEAFKNPDRLKRLTSGVLRLLREKRSGR